MYLYHIEGPFKAPLRNPYQACHCGEVLPRSSPIILPLKRVGLQHDRFTKIQLRQVSWEGRSGSQLVFGFVAYILAVCGMRFLLSWKNGFRTVDVGPGSIPFV